MLPGRLPVYAAQTASNVGAVSSSAPELHPEWTQNIGEYQNKGDQSIRGGPALLTIKEGQLLAIDTPTGKRMWKFGAYLESALATWSDLEGDYIFTVTKGGQLMAVSWSGKTIWTTQTGGYEEYEHVQAAGSYVFILKSHLTEIYKADSGKRLVKIFHPVEEGIGDPSVTLSASGTTMIRGFEADGAYISANLEAYDIRTGKHIWEQSGHQFSMLNTNSNLYSLAENMPLDLDASERHVTIDKIDIQSGKVAGSLIYNWTVPQSEVQTTPYETDAVLAYDRIYINQGKVIGVYNFSAYSKGQAPLRTIPLTADYYMTGSYAAGMLFLKDARGGDLKALNIETGEVMSWGNESQGSDKLVAANRIVIREKDNGTVEFYDLITGQLKATLSLKSDGSYGPVMYDSNSALIWKGNRIYGVQLPK